MHLKEVKTLENQTVYYKNKSKSDLWQIYKLSKDENYNAIYNNKYLFLW